MGSRQDEPMTSHIIRLCRRALKHVVTASAGLAICVTIAASTAQPARAGTFDAFGPENYRRAIGKPVVVIRSFSVLNPETTDVMRVVGYGPTGLPGQPATSAVILLNGARIFGPDDFRRRGRWGVVQSLENPVSLRTENQLTVELRGAPGSGVAIRIIGVDNDPPTIVATAAPPPNGNGWNRTPVTVTFACADATSGIAVCPAPAVVSTEGAGQIISGTAVDKAGNSATASVTLNIDGTPPDLTVSIPDDAACQALAHIEGTVEDSLSGVAGVACNGVPALLSGSSFTCHVPLVKGPNTIAVSARDRADNLQSESVQLDFADPALELAYVDQFQLRWWDKGSGAIYDGAFYRPVVPAGFHALAHYGQGDFGTPRGFSFAARELKPGALAAPSGYQQIWNDRGSGADLDGSMWRPVCPTGYASLGVVAQAGYGTPALDAISCVREDLLLPGKVGNQIYNDRKSGGDHDIGAWQVVPEDGSGLFVGAFTAIQDLYAVPAGPMFVLDPEAVRKSFAGCTSHAPSPAQIEQMVKDFGPTIRLHPDDNYVMDGPEETLDESAYLTWGHVQNETDYDNFYYWLSGRMKTSSDFLMADVESRVQTDPGFGDANFRHWLELDLGPTSGPPANLLLQAGDMSRARAFVRVRRWDHLFTELQFWFFYPYNGPGKWRLQIGDIDTQYVYMTTAGRHFGDWEQVTLRVANNPLRLALVNLSRHDFSEWVTSSQFGSRLQFDGTHPLVYAARDSHAHYPTAGTQYYKRVTHTSFGLGHIDVDLMDLTAGGGPEFDSFLPGNYVIVATETVPDANGDEQERVVDPEWLNFEGRWGQYERLRFTYTYDYGFDDYTYTFKEVGSGPSGPPRKGVWKNGPSSQLFWWTRNLETDEVCHDGVDNDGDGWVDTGDADCHQLEPASRLYGDCNSFPLPFGDPRAGTICENRCYGRWSGAGWTDC